MSTEFTVTFTFTVHFSTQRCMYLVYDNGRYIMMRCVTPLKNYLKRIQKSLPVFIEYKCEPHGYMFETRNRLTFETPWVSDKDAAHTFVHYKTKTNFFLEVLYKTFLF